MDRLEAAVAPAALLEVYRLQGRSWLLIATHTDDEKVRAEPFEILEVEILRWWAEVES